jgi:hypothetical protein
MFRDTAYAPNCLSLATGTLSIKNTSSRSHGHGYIYLLEIPTLKTLTLRQWRADS